MSLSFVKSKLRQYKETHSQRRFRGRDIVVLELAVAKERSKETHSKKAEGREMVMVIEMGKREEEKEMAME